MSRQQLWKLEEHKAISPKETIISNLKLSMQPNYQLCMELK